MSLNDQVTRSEKIDHIVRRLTLLGFLTCLSSLVLGHPLAGSAIFTGYTAFACLGMFIVTLLPHEQHNGEE